jgi:hypothetical protein
MSGLMVDSTERMLRRWEGARSRRALEMLSEMSRLTLEIVSRTLLGDGCRRQRRRGRSAVTALQAHVNYRATHLSA